MIDHSFLRTFKGLKNTLSIWRTFKDTQKPWENCWACLGPHWYCPELPDGFCDQWKRMEICSCVGKLRCLIRCWHLGQWSGTYPVFSFSCSRFPWSLSFCPSKLTTFWHMLVFWWRALISSPLSFPFSSSNVLMTSFIRSKSTLESMELWKKNEQNEVINVSHRQAVQI